MKILYSTDPHFKKRGSMTNESKTTDNPYGSARLDSLVKSYEYLYQVAVSEGVDVIINGGDFTDKPLISSEEAMSLEAIGSMHPDIVEYILVGNHDSKGIGNNVTNVLGNHPNIFVVDKPTKVNDEISLLPYTKEYQMDLSDIANPNAILFSHIDVIGTHLGHGIFTEVGFDPSQLSSSFKYVINGHIHSPTNLDKGFRDIYTNMINGGAFTGSGLGDNYSERLPGMLLIDTSTNPVSITPIVNPYSLLYFTINGNSLSEVIQGFQDIMTRTSGQYYGMHLRVVVPQDIKDEVRSYFDLIYNGEEYRGYKLLGLTVASQLTKRKRVLESSGSDDEYVNIESSMSVLELLTGFVDTQDVKSLPTDRVSLGSFLNRTYGGTDNES